MDDGPARRRAAGQRPLRRGRPANGVRNAAKTRSARASAATGTLADACVGAWFLLSAAHVGGAVVVVLALADAEVDSVADVSDTDVVGTGDVVDVTVAVGVPDAAVVASVDGALVSVPDDVTVAVVEAEPVALAVVVAVDVVVGEGQPEAGAATLVEAPVDPGWLDDDVGAATVLGGRGLEGSCVHGGDGCGGAVDVRGGCCGEPAPAGGPGFTGGSEPTPGGGEVSDPGTAKAPPPAYVCSSSSTIAR